jgi:hypothetical protein
MRKRILSGLTLALAALAGCTTGDMGTGLPGASSVVPEARPETETASAATGRHGRLDRLIAAYSTAYEVPASLIHRVVKRESNYDPSAYHAGNYGLMQIRYRTARGMGYDGKPRGLLDAETNLKYAVKYLKGAWLVAGGDEKRADRLYQTGYYYDAKRKGMLDEVGWNGTRLAATSEPAAATMPVPSAQQQMTVASASAPAAARQAAAPQQASKAAAMQPAFAEPSPVAVAGAQPDASRFGPAAVPSARPAEAARAVAMGYAGPTPDGQVMPAVMAAPPPRPAL